MSILKKQNKKFVSRQRNSKESLEDRKTKGMHGIDWEQDPRERNSPNQELERSTNSEKSLS